MTGTDLGKLESTQWSVVSDLAYPRKGNAKSAERMAKKQVSHRSPSVLQKEGEVMKR